jgi:hypothetical protein
VSAQGPATLGDDTGELIAFKRAEASSPLCPPERKAIPGTSAGTTRRSTRTVASATSAAVGRSLGRGQSGQNHDGFEDHRSERDALNDELRENRAQHGFGHLRASRHRVIPLHQHFGLDIGTSPASWQSPA